ncbi:hypothetical protein ACFQZT_23960 [Paenibacillus sp. GCM10027628]|uniref:hypothetical protein n=1 Tax=Paenibacillus sp. GCM10027628 TaxID=3273413 RepID=UPI0036267E62
MNVQAREKFKNALNYGLYYGYGEVDSLCRFDVAILEPGGQTESDLMVMQAANNVILAYLSMMEIADYDPDYRYLSEDDFLKNENGIKIKNEAFGTYLLDLSSRRWQGLLFHRIGRLLKISNYQGLFLDTIGNVEMSEIPHFQRGKQLEEAVELVKAIRSIHPNSVIVQNNGLNQLCMRTAEWIDGICWENPRFNDSEAKEWTYLTVSRLVQIANERSIKILLLLEKESSQDGVNRDLARQEAKKNGFLIYEAPSQYVSGVNEPIFL